MTDRTDNPGDLSRRQWLGLTLRAGAAAVVGGAIFGARRAIGGGRSHGAAPAGEWRWQIDPARCVACGNCQTYCVLTPSAVKCVHAYALCGYCKLCTGFFPPEPNALNNGAENQLCPTGAILRAAVPDEDPYYEYHIDEPACTGCAKCVAGCGAYGNGSLFLQVRHDRCVNCNQCRIAAACPAQAFVRVPAERPYLIKGQTPGPGGPA